MHRLSSRQSSFRGGRSTTVRSLVALLVLFFAGTAVAGAVCFDWPMGVGQVPGKDIRIYQNFAYPNSYYGGRPHAGLDVQYLHPNPSYDGDHGLHSIGQQVVAAADGVVIYNANANYPGHVVVLEHAGGIQSMYGHISPAAGLSVGTSVSRGQLLGTIIQWPNGATNSHLHFEIRSAVRGSVPGPGYSTLDVSPLNEGWYDPVQKIFAERSYPESVSLKYDRNVRNQSSISGGYLGVAPAGSHTLRGIETGGSSYPWWFRIDHNGGTGYVNAVSNYGFGSYLYFAHVGGCAGGGSGGTTDGASVGTVSYPASVVQGSPTPVTIRATNTGTSTWYASQPVRLASTGNNTLTWSGFQCSGYSSAPNDSRAFLCHDVAPGQSHDFHFSVTANSSSTQFLAAQMVRDGVDFFGSEVVTTPITVVGGGSSSPVAVSNGGMESSTTGQYGLIGSWGPAGGWAYHSGFPAGNNGTLGARFGFYSAGTSETVGQVLSETFAANTTYTFKSWALGGGNRTGVVPYQIGYSSTDSLGSFVPLETGTVNLTGNQSWVETAGVTHTTGGFGAELGRQIIIRFGDASAGGQSDIWFDDVTVTKQ